MKIRNLPGKSIIHIFLFVGSVIMFMPFLWMLSTSLKTPDKVLKIPPELIPNPISFESYRRVWVQLSFLRYTLNSFIIVILNIIGVAVICAIVAFGFAMFNFKGKKFFFMLMLGTLMMPGQVTLIPKYILWTKLGALDTYLPLIIPSVLVGSFGIFLLHQNFKSLPGAFYESALIDGCHSLKILFKIYVPMSAPTITALIVFTFLGAWNNTLEPLIYIKDRNLYTLSLGLLTLNTSTEAVANLAVKMAASAITMAPVIIVFLMAQKYFVEGVASSGIKG